MSACLLVCLSVCLSVKRQSGRPVGLPVCRTSSHRQTHRHIPKLLLYVGFPISAVNRLQDTERHSSQGQGLRASDPAALDAALARGTFSSFRGGGLRFRAWRGGGGGFRLLGGVEERQGFGCSECFAVGLGGSAIGVRLGFPNLPA